MKYMRFLSVLFLFLSLVLPCSAQTIHMREAGLIFDYPEDWLVISPQLARIYAPILAENGLDPLSLSEDMLAQGIQSRAYRSDFRQSMSVITRSDDLSMEIFDLDEATETQKKNLRRQAENNRLWETTGYRAQDVEWHKEGASTWLYIHYIQTFSDTMVGRGLRYITIRNGVYVMLDWQIDSGRFGNRDLAAFRARTHDLQIDKTLTPPVRPVYLQASIPQETTVSDLVITGTATGRAGLAVYADNTSGTPQLLSVGQAESDGRFSLVVPLEEEGVYTLTLTAEAEGMEETSFTSSVTYSAKTLPVSITDIEENGVHTITTSKTVLSGKTLGSANMQLVTPFGVSKKRSANDGTFSFELSTETAGEYRYTLIVDKNGFNQRRYAFTLVRVMTDEQAKDVVRNTAEKISYKQLVRDLPENRGKVMRLYGPVTEVSTGGDVVYLRIQFNKAADGTWYNPVILVCDTDVSAKVGDMITVVAEVSGVFEEQDGQGEPLMIPRFDVQFVDLLE